MIKSIKIENFKSVQSLEMELGRLNIFIGANGSGKSNILEAIAMGSAAMEDKLDDEFLVTRGIRVTERGLMKSAFDREEYESPIIIIWSNELIAYRLVLDTMNSHYNEWEITGNIENTNKLLDNATIEDIQNEFETYKAIVQNSTTKEAQLLKKVFDSIITALKEDQLSGNSKLNEYEKEIFDTAILNRKNKIDFFNFLIYAPENHFLRRFEEETAIKPLGIKGEGLFKLITIIAQEYPEQFKEIKKHLKLIDWFEDFEIPSDLIFTEKRIKIKDQYLDDDLNSFDQRSANEGFLYLLFYLTLFIGFVA